MNTSNDPYDILVQGGTLIDGAGAPRRVADVGIHGERIAAVGNLTGHRAEHEIDARGHVVAPDSSTCTPMTTACCSPTAR